MRGYTHLYDFSPCAMTAGCTPAPLVDVPVSNLDARMIVVDPAPAGGSQFLIGPAIGTPDVMTLRSRVRFPAWS